MKVTGKFLYENADDIALGLSVAALMVTPGGAAIALGVAAMAFSGAGAVKSFRKGDVVGGVLNLAGAVPGVRALSKTRQAARALDNAGDLARSADIMADGARIAEQSGLPNASAIASSFRQAEAIDRSASAAARVTSATRELEGVVPEAIGLGLGITGSARSHAHEHFGIDIPIVGPPGPATTIGG